MTAPTTARTARDLMHEGAECIDSTESVATAAAKMRSMDVGCLPVCGQDGKLAGMITDRDIVVECVARGRDLTTCMTGELAEGRPVYIEAGAPVDEVLRTMEQHQVRRLPVIEEHRLVGMISEADLSRALSDEQMAAFCRSVYAGGHH
ncbi:CBS domain-containing protein [Streptomyces sp. WAC 06738]|uniref:CBS domain-containing protein n=1 Tax=Streptomyces sp. WAC 06738 TaxID=2203210 RepID=UPI000F6E1B4A|nr:CBS domain-containing protein [Streptomyces sp. WAC 06738]AZM46885.1 CBS domain-containing protein [Streptomyces sp. WAC 06738]